MLSFEFATAVRIVFGAGSLRQLGEIARGCGHHALVVTGHNPSRASRVVAALRALDREATVHPIEHEPTIGDIEYGTRVARDAGCDFVIGIGGGAALDAAKAIAATMTNGGPLMDYLEVVGRGRPLAAPSAPCIAIPTTAGTGSEVTRNAVLASPEHRVKVSLRGPSLLPRAAIVDSELTYDLPAALTATTGLDAFTQLLEPYVCTRANPMTDALCLEGIRRVAEALPRAVRDGGDAAARENMAIGSLFGGIALANAGLGAVHGFAGPIGGAFPAPHGAICAALLPVVTAANLRALRTRASGSAALGRYETIARIVTGRPAAEAEALVPWLRDLVRAFGIPRLGAYGMTAADFAALVAAAAKASSMKANPIVLTSEECGEILDAAL